MESDLVIRIDLKSVTPAYRQIADAIRALIVEGRLKPDDHLPTVRQLAVDLVVHHNTVAQAYRELASEGWLDLRRRRGAVVTRRRKPSPTRDVQTRFDQRLRELIAKAHTEGLDSRAIASALTRLSRKMKETQS